MSAEIPTTPQTAEEAGASAPLTLSDNATARDASSLAQIDPGSAITLLPVQLDVRVPVPGFRVQDLLSLEKGRVLETSWSHGEDLPVWSGGVQLAWTEFEVVEQKLAARVTRLA
jgi:flagellar motor switch protein FliN/FliY